MTDTATRDELRQIAGTILKQIKAADPWCLAACGARDMVALDRNEDRAGGLMFRVTINPNLFHKVIIELTHLDDYRVILWGGKRKAIDGEELEEVLCYFDTLAEVVYELCNKREAA